MAYFNDYKTKQYSFYLEEDLATRFDVYCKEHRINKSAFFRDAIRTKLGDILVD